MTQLALCLAAMLSAPLDEAAAARYHYDEMHMGMPFRITLYSAEESIANSAAKTAFKRIAQLNQILSDYDPQSELSRLSDSAGSGRAVHVSDDLWTVLVASQRLAERTDGAFDITVSPFVKLWRRARRTGQMPSPERLAAARQAVGYRKLVLDAEHQTARLTVPDMRLDLGGIAAGYAVDEALKVLRRHGITSAMVDASGDIGVSDAPPGAAGWRVGIAPLEKPDGAPSRYLLLVNQAVTTSGDAFQFVEIQGRRYSHIVDPATGLGLTQRSSVTVVVDRCLAADSLATAVSVLGPERALQFIDDTPGAAALIVLINNEGKAGTLESRRWDLLSVENQAP